MVVNELIESMKNLGFSEYEARAYLCLLKIQPATAYEIAQASGIPSSKVYEIIARLVDKQVFMPDGEDARKRKYMALLPDEFVERQKSHFGKTFAVLEKELPSLQNEKPVSFIWNIGDYDLLIEKAERMIENAGNSLLLSSWKTERDHLEPYLEKAQSRDVNIAAIHFGKRQHGAGALFHHPIEDTIYREKGGRGLVIVRDSHEALVGTIDENGMAHGAFSVNPGFVTLAEDYIKHDIYIMKIVARFDPMLIETFGKNYSYLRNIFEDKDIP
jgi:HTH-type transcriptional regulator, sugar sensing transcriptional regulator